LILSLSFLHWWRWSVISSRCQLYLSRMCMFLWTYMHIYLRHIVTIICKSEKKFLIFLLSIFLALFFLPFHALVFVAILILLLLHTIRPTSLLKFIIVVFEHVGFKLNEERSRMQSIFNLYLSLPISCPSFCRYNLYWRNLYFYTNLVAHTRPWYT